MSSTGHETARRESAPASDEAASESAPWASACDHDWHLTERPDGLTFHCMRCAREERVPD